MTKFFGLTPGIFICTLIAIPSFILGRAFPVIGGPVFGILAGIIIKNTFPYFLRNTSYTYKFSKSLKCEAGVKYTSKKLLQYSIILLGFEMNLFNIIKVGSQSLFVMIFTLTSSFLTAFIIGKALKIKGKATVLIGVGTSICGGSAIAATAPVINAEDEDVAQAISTIFLFNIVAVFIFPTLGLLLNMTDVGFGMWAGTAINDTSSVVAAGVSWSASAGNDTALAFATIVKLTRTLMIVPITLVLAIYTSHKSKLSDNSSNFAFTRVFPLFIIGFVAAAVVNTFTAIPDSVTHSLVITGKFMIIMAMSAIGLNTDIKYLVKNGMRPILLGLCCWVSVACVSLIVQISASLW